MRESKAESSAFDKADYIQRLRRASEAPTFLKGADQYWLIDAPTDALKSTAIEKVKEYLRELNEYLELLNSFDLSPASRRRTSKQLNVDDKKFFRLVRELLNVKEKKIAEQAQYQVIFKYLTQDKMSLNEEELAQIRLYQTGVKKKPDQAGVHGLETRKNVFYKTMRYVNFLALKRISENDSEEKSEPDEKRENDGVTRLLDSSRSVSQNQIELLVDRLIPSSQNAGDPSEELKKFRDELPKLMEEFLSQTVVRQYDEMLIDRTIRYNAKTLDSLFYIAPPYYNNLSNDAKSFEDHIKERKNNVNVNSVDSFLHQILDALVWQSFWLNRLFSPQLYNLRGKREKLAQEYAARALSIEQDFQINNAKIYHNAVFKSEVDKLFGREEPSKNLSQSPPKPNPQTWAKIAVLTASVRQKNNDVEKTNVALRFFKNAKDEQPAKTLILSKVEKKEKPQWAKILVLIPSKSKKVVLIYFNKAPDGTLKPVKKVVYRSSERDQKQSDHVSSSAGLFKPNCGASVNSASTNVPAVA